MTPDKRTFIDDIANLVGGKLAREPAGIFNLSTLSEAVVHGFSGFQDELNFHRDEIIKLRDHALGQGEFGWAVNLSHTVAFLSYFQTEATLPPPKEPYLPKLDRVGQLEEALLQIKHAIINAPKDILTDTFWMPEETIMGATVVDFIDGLLNYQDT